MWTALILGSLAAIGSIVGGVISARAQKKANEANVQMQRETNETNKQLQESANQTNVELAEKEMSFNSAEAEKERQFEAEQSNTAIQRRMDDLRAAGVNPMLALGSPAQMASGYAASASSARVDAAQMQAPRVQAEDAMGSSLQHVASIAQSAATMMAISKINDARTSSYADSKKYAADKLFEAKTKDYEHYTYQLADKSWLSSRRYK